MTNNDSGAWYFTDNSLPEPYRDGTETLLIQSEQQLSQLLRYYSCRQPRIVIIESPWGACAFVGIGGALAGVTYYAHPRAGRSLTAKPKDSYASDAHWFKAVGESREFPAVNLMPADTVIGIILHLYRTGELSDSVDWL